MLKLATTSHKRKEKFFTPSEIIQLVDRFGSSARYLPNYLKVEGRSDTANMVDIIFVSLDYYSENRLELLKCHLETLKCNSSVIVGISKFEDQAVFDDFYSLGIQKIITYPISYELLISELSENLLAIKKKFLSQPLPSFNQIAIKKETLKNGQLTRIMANSIVYYKSKNSINSDLYFRKRLDNTLYFVIGEGGKPSLENSLKAADIVSQLNQHISDNGWHKNSIFNDINSVLKVPFEFIELNGSTMEVKYKGSNQTIFVRDNRLMDLPQDSPISLKYGDTFFLFSDGLEKQVGHMGAAMGRAELTMFFLLLASLDVSEMKGRICSFLGNWKNRGIQTDDITLLAFRI